MNLKIIMQNSDDYILHDFILSEMMMSYKIRKEVGGLGGNGDGQREG